MSFILEPTKAIVPIVRSTKEKPIVEVLGTGFFVGTGSELHLITAKHVIDCNPLKEGERYAITFPVVEGIKVVAASHVIRSPKFDLAACKFSKENLPRAVTLPVSKIEPSLNDDVLSFEYSSTRIVGGRYTRFL